jgi:hypothetical protein
MDNNNNKSLVQLVYGWGSAYKLQRLWRIKWCKRTTLHLIQTYFATYSRDRMAGMM